jgi:capsular polysaccharide biosynthesis protein
MSYGDEEAVDPSPRATATATHTGRRESPYGYGNGGAAELSAPSLGRSVANHWQTVGAVVLICALIGVVAGFFKPPTYHARADLIVGKTQNLANIADIAGLAAAGNQIAEDYGRLIDTPTVLNDVAKRLGYQPPSGSLTATATPNTPTLLVEASARSSSEARAIATAGSAAMVDAVNIVNGENAAASASLISAYQAASQAQAQADQKVSQLQSQIGALSASPANAGTVAGLNQQLIVDEAAADTARLKASALESQYQSSVSPVTEFSQVLTPLGPAVSTGSDRTSDLEIGLIIGVVGGLVLGAAAASISDVSLPGYRRRGQARRDLSSMAGIR